MQPIITNEEGYSSSLQQTSPRTTLRFSPERLHQQHDSTTLFTEGDEEAGRMPRGGGLVLVGRWGNSDRHLPLSQNPYADVYKIRRKPVFTVLMTGTIGEKTHLA
jgi:hypothetical protein